MVYNYASNCGMELCKFLKREYIKVILAGGKCQVARTAIENDVYLGLG